MSTTQFEWAVPDASERTSLEALVGQALNFPQPMMTWWVEQIGLTEFRVLRERGRIVAAVGFLRMGQWYAGRRVPFIGITAVGVALDRRGQGVGGALMRHTLAELHTDGVPLAGLYPSSLAFYRSVGFERAGTRLSFEAPLANFAARRTALDVAPAADGEQLKQIYAGHAADIHAAFDRSSFIWNRIVNPPDTTPAAYIVGDAHNPQGYVVLSQAGRDAPLQIRDLVMRSGAAGRQIGALLAGQRTMVDNVAWNGGPDDPFGWLLPARQALITRSLDWMLRIVDVPAALRQRGYPAATSGELHLDVRDAELRQNHGRFMLTVADGRADVRPGGDGRLGLDIRDLAALYTGHASPQLLRQLGGLAGDDASLALAAALFGSQRPQLADMF